MVGKPRSGPLDSRRMQPRGPQGIGLPIWRYRTRKDARAIRQSADATQIALFRARLARDSGVEAAIGGGEMQRISGRTPDCDLCELRAEAHLERRWWGTRITAITSVVDPCLPSRICLQNLT
jgi:hypothetical protein